MDRFNAKTFSAIKTTSIEDFRVSRTAWHRDFKKMALAVEDDFKDDHDVTVGVEFGSHLIKVEDKILKLQVWDTAGQESFRSITKIFYRGAHVVILAYSIINALSFENLTDWLREVRT